MQLKTNVFADGRALIKSCSAAARYGQAIIFAVAAVFACPAEAAFVTYASRTEFNAAHPQLPLEDFETGADGNRFGFFDSGLNSSTSNDVFDSGDILPGIEFASTLGASYLPDWHLFAAGPAAEPQATSTILGQTFFAESLNIDFAPGVSAVGLDVSVIAAATTPINVVSHGVWARRVDR